MSKLVNTFSKSVLLMGMLTGSGTAAFAHEPTFPLTLENCGQTITMTAPPARVVSIGQASTELFYRLGLHDHVVGTANWFTDVAEEFAEINANIERLADNFPSFEGVISKRPDLVTADFLFAVGPQGVVGKPEQFHSLGINTYIMDSECVSHGDDSPSTHPTGFTLDSLYQSIRNLSTAFDVLPIGEDLIQEIQGRETTAIAQASEHNSENLSAVFWFSSADIQMDPWVAGSTGVPAWMLSTLGVQNIIDAPEEWPTVGWESIAKANPDIIVIAQMTRRRFDADDHQKKIEFLNSDPVTRHMDAVKNNNIITMDAHAMRATLRSIEGLETLAEALKSLDLKE